MISSSGSCCPARPCRPTPLARPGARQPGGWPQRALIAAPAMARRLVAVAYRTEQEAGDKVLRLGPQHRRLAVRQPGALELRPAGGRAAQARRPMSRWAAAPCMPPCCGRARKGGYDLSRLSVDVLSRAEVEDAFADLGLASGNVHVREEPGRRRGARRVPRAPVAAPRDRGGRHLPGIGGPAAGRARYPGPGRAADPQRDPRRRCGPPPCWGPSAGWKTRNWPSRWSRCPRCGRHPARSAPRQPREELRLIVHRLLLQEAQRIKATLSPAGEDTLPGHRDPRLAVRRHRRLPGPAVRRACPRANSASCLRWAWASA